MENKTLRDEFALAALPSLIMAHYPANNFAALRQAVIDAYKTADIALEVRNENQAQKSN